MYCGCVMGAVQCFTLSQPAATNTVLFTLLSLYIDTARNSSRSSEYMREDFGYIYFQKKIQRKIQTKGNP